MSEKIELYFTGTIKLTAPLHIGTGKDSEPYDAPLRRTADGRLFIPGRALGGVLRSTATLLAPRISGISPCQVLLARPDENPRQCGCPVCELFGEIKPGEEEARQRRVPEGGKASQLWIEDAYLAGNGEHEPPEPDTLLRDGVGISRPTKAAARHAKFGHELVPAGTIFDFHLRWVDQTEGNEDDAHATRARILAATLAEWQSGRVTLGGNSVRGAGSIVLDERLKKDKLNVQSADDLEHYLLAHPNRRSGETWLTPRPDWLSDNVEQARARIQKYEDIGEVSRLRERGQRLELARSYASVDILLEFDGPFLSNDPRVAARVGLDHAPMLDCVLEESAGKPIITGSSLRGAVRSHAERIARTLAMLELDLPDTLATEEDKVKCEAARRRYLQTCPCCDPLVSDCAAALANCDSRWRKEEENAVNKTTVQTDHLCLGCRLFGSTRLGSRLRFSDALWAGGGPGPDSWKIQDFLAIDRFTGGGLDGAKFDAAPLLGSTFRFQVRLTNPEAWELGWLALALRDLCQGEITVGFGAAKGYGRPQGKVVKWEIGYITAEDFPVDESSIAVTSLLDAHKSDPVALYQISSGDAGNGSAWLDQLDSWVTAFNQKLREHEAAAAESPSDEVSSDVRPAPVPFEADSYLTEDGKLFEAYGLPRTEGDPDHA